ncbi:hypothetical protein EDI_246800 [Entamoeba dispar SAW760]|uniref:Uncharacterized protein n=1 Tax=Entamoeba dispar (strain ATCC PRA-260 / SAW760) TaxID=370354 RepID=B0EPT0_ENTDS|nr:uncharacterized protein EDI_246800 [Entamoeba dispar SAW760]EDR23467.1 hypothetical protein EDI_246800 [Entamoeba dispar SAW760]|eukprot:EDR23467.1 hypothetical protein EDI_246800 [Entamoeba dispar SAW760]
MFNKSLIKVFIYYIIPIIIFIFYFWIINGSDSCNKIRFNYYPSLKDKILDPQYWIVTVSLIIACLICIEYDKYFCIYFTSVIDLLNAYVFHRWNYYIICMLKVSLNDTNCTEIEKIKFNGISGHYFTIIYFFGIFLHLLSTIPHSNTSMFVSFERHFPICYFPLVHYLSGSNKFNKYHKRSSTRIIMCSIGLILYITFSYLCMYNTLIYGFHSPRQVLYGVIASFISLITYSFFLQIPFIYRSVVNFILYTGCYVLLCLVTKQPATNDTLILFPLCSLIMTLFYSFWTIPSNEFED